MKNIINIVILLCIILLIAGALFYNIVNNVIEKKFQEEKIKDLDTEVENLKKEIDEYKKQDKVREVDIDSNDIKNNEYVSYQNSRFRFSIKYPDTFRPILVSDNNDGIKLANEDESSILTVYGSNNAFRETVISAYEKAIKEHRNISYKKQKGNWFVVSWSEGNTIFYQKSVVGKGSINTFIFEYPADEKSMYDPIVSVLNKSFKTPGINYCF